MAGDDGERIATNDACSSAETNESRDSDGRDGVIGG